MKDRPIDRHRARARGFTLVELMIALVLGLLVLGAVFSVLGVNQQSNRVVEAMSALQENGRYAIGKMVAELRRSGYSGFFGDLDAGVENVLNSPTNPVWSISDTIRAYDNVPAGTNIGGIAGFVPGSDVLLVTGMSDSVPLGSNPDTDTFTVDANLFASGDILLVAGCDQAALFQATSVSTVGSVTTILHAAGGGMTPGNSGGTVNTRFGAEAEIGRLNTTLYYIKNRANGRPALYQARLAVTGGSTVALREEKLIDEAEDLQLSFGVDTDADLDADVYRSASAVTGWGAVLSVRIALLLASREDNLAEQDNSFSFNASAHNFSRDTTPAVDADRRLRRVFTGVAALRNRNL